MLDKFVSFARSLPAERLDAIEEVLASLIASHETDFTPDELAEINRRAADPNPRYSDPSVIEGLLGRPFSA